MYGRRSRRLVGDPPPSRQTRDSPRPDGHRGSARLRGAHLESERHGERTPRTRRLLPPAVLARDYDLRLSPGLVFLVALAVFLHAVGIAGPYDSTEWWDHLTHALSAVVVGSIAYATVVALDIHREDLQFPPRFLAVFLLATTLGFGVLWEVLEFGAHALGGVVGAKSVLVVYGVSDVTLDLVYNAVGGVIVATVGTYRLREDVLRITIWLETERD